MPTDEQRTAEGQGSFFTPCRPLATERLRNGYRSRCACGWKSAVEYRKKYAMHVLAYHLDQTLTEAIKKSLKECRTTADRTV